jgi:hypothetical protein
MATWIQNVEVIYHKYNWTICIVYWNTIHHTYNKVLKTRQLFISFHTLHFILLLHLITVSRWGKLNLFVHSFHWHVQNVTISCRSQELLPFLFFFFSSTTLYEFWLAQLFLSIVFSLVPSVSSSSLPSFSGHFSRRLPILILAFLSVLLRTISIHI